MCIVGLFYRLVIWSDMEQMGIEVSGRVLGRALGMVTEE